MLEGMFLMDEGQTDIVLSPSLLMELEDVLTRLYWFKPDLRSFLEKAGVSKELISRADWTQNKRSAIKSISSQLQTVRYHSQLIRLANAVYNVDDPTWLQQSMKSADSYPAAKKALSVFKRHAKPLQDIAFEQIRVKERQGKLKEKLAAKQDEKKTIADLKHDFAEIGQKEPQSRGYAFEKFLIRLFQVSGIEAWQSYKIPTEQIDGTISFENTYYLIEAKWKQKQTPKADIAIFADKVRGKMDNTLGLFISMNGFEKSAKNGTSDRPSTLLMDGADLSLVLDEFITMKELLRRKHAHAARTGEMYISASDLLLGEE
jgi:hypothetical protein